MHTNTIIPWLCQSLLSSGYDHAENVIPTTSIYKHELEPTIVVPSYKLYLWLNHVCHPFVYLINTSLVAYTLL